MGAGGSSQRTQPWLRRCADVWTRFRGYFGTFKGCPTPVPCGSVQHPLPGVCCSAWSGEVCSDWTSIGPPRMHAVSILRSPPRAAVAPQQQAEAAARSSGVHTCRFHTKAASRGGGSRYTIDDESGQEVRAVHTQCTPPPPGLMEFTHPTIVHCLCAPRPPFSKSRTVVVRYQGMRGWGMLTQRAPTALLQHPFPS